MANESVPYGTGKQITVTDEGTTVDFGQKITRVTLKSQADSANIVAYSIEDDTLVTDAAPADEAAIRASRLFLEPGDLRGRTGLNARKAYLRCAAGETAEVRVETI